MVNFKLSNLKPDFFILNVLN